MVCSGQGKDAGNLFCQHGSNIGCDMTICLDDAGSVINLVW